MLQNIPKNLRKIKINEEQDVVYPDNSIKTAKYNLITFIPLALLNQFTNYFNIFFLVTAIIQSIPTISPVDPGSAIGPFLFVLVISMIREAFEDAKKAKYDKNYNESLSLEYNFITDSFMEIKWKDIGIGRVVKILKDEVIPADLLIIKTSAENGFCYLQTTNLDGESSLKPRETMILFQDLIRNEEDIKNINGDIELDQPDNNIYKLDGSVKLADFERAYFDINNILLRGGTLKNVEYIYGIVIYTGKDTKIMKNIKQGSTKFSSIEVKLNKIVIFIIGLTLIICIICTVFGMIFWNNNKPKENDLEMDHIFNKLNNNDGATLEIFKTFAGFFTIFNTLIPISIMIILEVVKAMQVYFVERDPLYKLDEDDKFKNLSMKLHEDLGNVKYIFTDKTGTLTRNEMEFRACSIFTKLFDDEKKSDDDGSTSFTKRETASVAGSNLNSIPHKKSIFSSKFDTQYLRESLLSDHPIDIIDLHNTPFYSMKDVAMEFFLNISINHSVLTEIDSKTKEKVYTGSNPDEIVLVQAARELGIEFIERTNKFVRIKIFDEEFTFKILYRFEYTSARMRSSVIVQDQFNVIKLYMKGADSIILKKLDLYSKNFVYESTKEHLDKFAKNGLRTLCYSMKIIDEEIFENWEYEFKIIQEKAMKDKSLVNLLEKTISQIEDDMLLIGVSGLEDKLQDDVCDCLQDFIEAGINVWMLTGDKLDTAESIGYSCKLFNDDTEVFKIKAGNEKEVTLNSVKEILDKMETIEKELLEFKIEKKRKKRRGEKITKNPQKKNNQEKLILEKNRFDKIIENKMYKERPGTSCNLYHPNINYSNSIANQISQPLPFKLKRVESSNLNRIRNSEMNRGRTNTTIFAPLKQGSESRHFIDEIGNRLDINQLNDQIKNENMKFIGTQVDNRNNMVTLNFIRQNSIDQNSKDLKHHEILKDNPVKLRPASSNIYSIKRRNFDNFFDKAKKLDMGAGLNNANMDDSNPEDDDMDIIRFMIDKNFFENNQTFINEGNFTFLNNLLSKQTTVINKDEPPVPSRFYQGNNNNENQTPLKSINNNLLESDKNYDYYSNQNDENVLSFRHSNKVPSQKVKSPLNESIDKDNFDLMNLYEHYQTKIKNLESHNNYGLLNFNFVGNNEEENDNKDISMKNFGLIIEGAAISQCLEVEIAPIFWECLRKSRSVICCRCAPIQKSEVVHFVKHFSGDITLSIGDGGNDVNMIKEANVGVGIFGKEGYQAAFNADYAISQFKYLKRLLFVHGRFSMLRNSYFINFFFYKNLMFTFPQFWFAFANGFSGSLLWDDWYTLGFNSFLTTIPAAVRMLFEEDIDISFEDYPHKKIMEYMVPDIYREYRNSRPFNIPKFFFVFIGGVIHSILIYYIPYFILQVGIMDGFGRTSSLWNQSLISYWSLIIIHYYVLIEDSYYLGPLGLLAHSVQIVVYILFLFIYELGDNFQLSGVTFDILSSLQFWLILLLTVYISILPVMIMRRLEVLFSDSIINNLRHKKYEHDYAKKVYMKKLSEMQKYTRSLAKFKKIYNLNSEFQPDNLADKKIKDMVDTYRNTKIKIITSKHEMKKEEKAVVSVPANISKKKEIMIPIIQPEIDYKKTSEENKSDDRIAQLDAYNFHTDEHRTDDDVETKLIDAKVLYINNVLDNTNKLNIPDNHFDSEVPSFIDPDRDDNMNKDRRIVKNFSTHTTEEKAKQFDVIEEVTESRINNDTKSNIDITMQTNKNKSRVEGAQNNDPYDKLPIIRDYPLEISNMFIEENEEIKVEQERNYNIKKKNLKK